MNPDGRNRLQRTAEMVKCLVLILVGGLVSLFLVLVLGSLLAGLVKAGVQKVRPAKASAPVVVRQPIQLKPASAAMKEVLREPQTASMAREMARRAALARIERLERELGTLRQQLLAARHERDQFNARVSRYMMNHKGVCLAIGATLVGADIVIDKDKKRTEGEKWAAGAGSVLGLLYAASNWEETRQVLDTLLQAEAAQKNQRTAIGRLESEIRTVEARLEQERARLR